MRPLGGSKIDFSLAEGCSASDLSQICAPHGWYIEVSVDDSDVF